MAELAKQIKSDSEARRDFRVPTQTLKFVPEGDRGRINFKIGKDRFSTAPTRHCLRQVSERGGIPAKYVDRMLESGSLDLLADNINHWWTKEPDKRMLRTLINGTQVARAFLSERYRPLENIDLMATIMPKLSQLDVEILSCEITETRLYIQAATPKIEAKLVGDKVRAGVCISNSEVGQGAINIDPLLYYLACKNGAIAQRVMKRHHIGRRNDPMFELDAAAEYFTDATREQDDKAFWMKVRDVVDGLFDRDRFNALVESFENTTAQKIKPIEAVEEVTNRFQFNETERDAILNHLIEGGNGNNLFGLINAVTRTATDVESYDRSIELQRIGMEMMELPKSFWQSKN